MHIATKAPASQQQINVLQPASTRLNCYNSTTVRHSYCLHFFLATFKGETWTGLLLSTMWGAVW
jgi:hypothetical protein